MASLCLSDHAKNQCKINDNRSNPISQWNSELGKKQQQLFWGLWGMSEFTLTRRGLQTIPGFSNFGAALKGLWRWDSHLQIVHFKSRQLRFKRTFFPEEFNPHLQLHPTPKNSSLPPHRHVHCHVTSLPPTSLPFYAVHWLCFSDTTVWKQPGTNGLFLWIKFYWDTVCPFIGRYMAVSTLQQESWVVATESQGLQTLRH